jgi:hypothetical protein
MNKRLYITTNLINGKVYAGKHNWKDGTKYMGSGYALKKAFAKYGKENFKIRWLKLKIETSEDLDRLEIRLIRLLKYRYGNRCYNIQKGGSGGYFTYYMSDEEKQEVFRKISESKKRQYANGLTIDQLNGRERAKITRIETMADDKNYQKVYVEGCQKRIISLKNRRKLLGPSEKEIARNNNLVKHSIKYISYKILYPSGLEITETRTVNDFINTYKTDWNIFTVARKNGRFIFKRRTSKTKHPFPVNTQLFILNEIKGCDV